MLDLVVFCGLLVGVSSYCLSMDKLFKVDVVLCFCGMVLLCYIGVEGWVDDQYVLFCCIDGVFYVWECSLLNYVYLVENGLG